MNFPPPIVAYATGPDAIGAAQNHPFDKRWAAWVSDNGVRIARLPLVTPPANAVGDPCEVYGSQTVSRLSLAFDQNSRPVIAIQKAENTIEIKHIVAGVLFTFTFPGQTPLLFQNGLLRYYPGTSDVVCHYILAGDKRLYTRFQREDFGNTVDGSHNGTDNGGKYILNTLHSTPTELLQTEATGDNHTGRRQVLYARNIFEKLITLTSWMYPPWPVEVLENITLATTAGAGAYVETVATRSATEKATVDDGFKDGEYLNPTVSRSVSESSFIDDGLKDGTYTLTSVDGGQSTEKIAEAIGFEDGAHEYVPMGSAIPTDAGTEKIDEGITTGAGELKLVVKDGGHYTEKAPNATTFLSGIYQPE